uniref:ADP-ribosyl cyclase/cyclic ADP-ribose hydrolase n=1 Tax=Vitis vinifera TaxID=29760 RepID=F6H978_VITVI
MASSTSSFTASSSSTPSIPKTSPYDVFLSFRGEDTRYNFTDHLNQALVRRGIRTFRDDKIRRGEEVAPELLKVIEESRKYLNISIHSSFFNIFSFSYCGEHAPLKEERGRQ